MSNLLRFFFLSFTLSSALMFRSQTPLYIKLEKEPVSDSVFIDWKNKSLYSKTSGFENRFKTLKRCAVVYSSKWKSGKIILYTNKFSQQITNLFYAKAKKMEIRFVDIVLRQDSLNSKERSCPPILITINRKRDFHLYYGVSGKVFFPIPHWVTVDTVIKYN